MIYICRSIRVVVAEEARKHGWQCDLVWHVAASAAAKLATIYSSYTERQARAGVNVPTLEDIKHSHVVIYMTRYQFSKSKHD